MADDLEQLKNYAEMLEEKAKKANEARELKKRIRIAKASLRQDTIVSQIFRGLKKRADKVVNDSIN